MAATRAAMLHTTARVSNVVCILARCGGTSVPANVFAARRRRSPPVGRKPNTATAANTSALSGSAMAGAGEYGVPQLAYSSAYTLTIRSIFAALRGGLNEVR
jgi:hypothetical protein